MVVQVHGIGGIRDVSNNSQKGDMGSRTKTRARKKVDSNDSEHENQPIMGAVDHHVRIHRFTFTGAHSLSRDRSPQY